MNRIRFLATSLLVVLSGCSLHGWTTHRDRAGFTVDLPPGWTSQFDASSGRVDFEGPEGAVSILPVFSRTALTRKQAEKTLMEAAFKQWNDMQWFGRVETAGASALRMGGLGSRTKATVSFAWTATPAGTAGYIYRVQCLKDAPRQNEAVLARVLASFRMTGGGSGGAPAAKSRINYVRWTDPRETAFTIEVPAGWKVEGGLIRVSAVDPRGVWAVTSPDGSVKITGGDAQVPVHVVPNHTLAFSGFREGSWYSPGYGTRMLVRRFVDGASFAREYVAQRAGSVCADLSFTETRNRPDLAAGGSGTSFGDVSFTCTQNGRPMRGYYLAGTKFTGMQGIGIWNMEHLIGFLAAPEQVDTARTVMMHIVQTAQLNPEWVAGQQRTTQAVSNIVARTNAEISQQIDDSYWSRHAGDSEMSRRQSNATLGVVDAEDPETGRRFRVESGSDYYWIDNAGHIAGTRTDSTPNVDFRQLVTLP